MRNLSYTKKGPGRRHRGPGHAKRKAEWMKKNAVRVGKHLAPEVTTIGKMWRGMKLFVMEHTEDWRVRLRGALGYFKTKDSKIKLRSK